MLVLPGSTSQHNAVALNGGQTQCTRPSGHSKKEDRRPISRAIAWPLSPPGTTMGSLAGTTVCPCLGPQTFRASKKNLANSPDEKPAARLLSPRLSDLLDFSTGRNPILIRHFRPTAALPRSFFPVTSVARGEPDMPPFVYTGHAALAVRPPFPATAVAVLALLLGPIQKWQRRLGMQMAPYPVLHRIDKPSVSDMHAAPIALCVAAKDEHGPL
ncbi:hypothetical protein CPLU01_00577 [Colletotrichum plurivorum]|uniref:Uncharacterized protein n=1 Tax=Colletotrichum plurivorum TaxID=2175906 RepID=A0A8H6U603_9PEZI|nr:hypothetical protein CPLU01_00577 [Colletotrichum plurivorum]